MVALPIDFPAEAIEEFCRKWRIREFAVFGSVLRDDFSSDSDVDVLVTFDEDSRRSLWDMVAAEQELAGILERHVDLVERCAVENSENWIRRRSILDTARTIYAG